MSCVRDVLTINCGTDASGLFQDLVKAHVPTSVCETEANEQEADKVNKVRPDQRVLHLCAILIVPVVAYLTHSSSN